MERTRNGCCVRLTRRWAGLSSRSHSAVQPVNIVLIAAEDAGHCWHPLHDRLDNVNQRWLPTEVETANMIMLCQVVILQEAVAQICLLIAFPPVGRTASASVNPRSAVLE